MFENNSKFPRFFIFMLVAIACIMLSCIFFSSTLVGYTYFIALIICVVYLMIDRHYAEPLTNYKLSFFLFDLINLIAVIAVLYYELSSKALVLSIFVIILFIVEIALLVVDVFLVKIKNVSKKESLYVGLFKLASIICVCTYFYNVSDLYFAIIALAFELSNLIVKIAFNSNKFKLKSEKEDLSNDKKIEQFIRSVYDNQGDLD